MATIDYRLALHNQVWTLLEANSAFTPLVKPGNRIKATTDAYARRMNRRAPADFPWVAVEIRGGARSGFRAPKTLGMNDTSATVTTLGDPIVPATQDVLITVVYDKQKLDVQTPVETAIEQSLYGKYPKLGLAYVTDFVLTKARKEVAEPGDDAVSRTVCAILLGVSLRLRLSQIVG